MFHDLRPQDFLCSEMMKDKIGITMEKWLYKRGGLFCGGGGGEFSSILLYL